MAINHYIRLRDEISVTEFYTDDQPADYLKNIRDLNIIVGANNSRKSRFIRKLINLDHRVIIKSANDLNQLGAMIEDVFKGVSKETMSTKLIGFIFNGYNDNPKDFQLIKDYFERSAGIDNGLSLNEIKTIMQDAVKNMHSVAGPDSINQIHVIVATQALVINLITRIYLGLKRDFNNFKDNAPNDSGLKGITYKIPGASSSGIPDYDIKLTALERSVKFLKEFQEKEIIPYHDIDLIYIPVLRASRQLEGADSKVFKATLQTQHKIGENARLSIETGLDLYEKIEMARNGHRREREDFAAFESFISSVFFQGKAFDIIAVKGVGSTDKHVKVTIDGELDDVPIHDLGDGIQTIISLLLPVFTAKDRSWIFVDEPENHLHPGFQNIFLRAISENKLIKAKELKFFISTHSNHILSGALMGTSGAEVLVFSRRDKDSSNIQVFSGNEYNTLQMLGVFNTSVLITNCSIWVEGVTDRLYTRAFLHAYCNADLSRPLPVEGFQYSYIEYAGNNIIHYDFDHDLAGDKDNATRQIKAFFLNSNVFLLADSDFSKDERHSFYDGISKGRKNFEYFKTELPEIENILPDSLLKRWLIEDVKCNPVEVDSCFQSPDRTLKLGALFDNKFTIGQRKRKFMEKGHSGTLRADHKMRLADYVHNGIMNGTISWDDLKESDVLGRLVGSLYSFITAKNNV